MTRLPTTPRGGIGGPGTQRQPAQQHSFSAGEMSPRMFGRTDLQKYYSGTQKLENFLLLKQGVATRRPGSRFVASSKFSDRFSRLIRFEFSKTQTYVLEFGHEYIRFFSNGVQLESAPGTPTEIASPYTEDDLPDIKVNQSADVMTICHPTIQQRLLSRTAGDDTQPGTWTLEKMRSTDGPYIDLNVLPTMLNVSAPTGNITITSAEGSPFSAADAPSANNDGRLVRILHKEWGVARITNFVNTNTVNATVLHPFVQWSAWRDHFGQNVDDITQLGGWTREWGAFGSIKTDANSAAHGLSLATAGYLATNGIQQADNLSVGAVFISKETNSTMAVAMNVADEENYYAAEFTSATTANFVKVVNGVRTVLHTAGGLSGNYTLSMNHLGSNVFFKVGLAIVHSEGADPLLDSPRAGIIAIHDVPGDANITGSKIDSFRLEPADFKRSSTWQFGAWSDTTGWPHCSQYHKDRQWFGATNSQPNRIDGSESDIENEFTPNDRETGEVLAEHALSLLIKDNFVNQIRWIRSHQRGLLMMTDSGPFTLTSGEASQPISALNFSIVRNGTKGVSSRAMPIVIDSTIMFTEDTGSKVYEMGFSFADDAFATADMTILAEHLTSQHKIINFTYQEEPDSVFWALREDGVLIGLTYERNEEIVGWHVQKIGGDNAFVESMTVIREGGVDELWLSVKRTIQGSEVRHVEVIGRRIEVGDDPKAGLLVDSGLTYLGAPTNTFSGLDHLEGEEVHVVAGGIPRGSAVVSSGSVTIAEEVSSAQIGLPYVSTLTTMPIAPRHDFMENYGSFKKPSEIFIMLENTIGGEISVNGSEFEPFADTEPEDYLLEPGDGFSGIRRHPAPGDDNRRSTITVRQSLPCPMTVLAIGYYYNAG